LNFLAHIYLSGNNEHVKVGNFVADWIKGNEYKKFPEGIQKGILIHRKIDFFTDNHLIIKKSKNRFSEKYRKYAGIIIDVCYDHFLAKDWNTYSEMSLHDIVVSMKTCFHSNSQYFTPELQKFFPHFLNHGWIEMYPTIDGIEKVLTGMSKHTSLPDETVEAIRIFREYYSDFQAEFDEYFPQLIRYVEENFQIIVRPVKK
jgi:acyl carrier protein phosphodiesterase